MHNLESILLLSSVALRKGKISKRELANTLGQLASASHSYEPRPYEQGPYRNADEELNEMSEEWGRRFGHLMIGDQK